jgi:APA family basic amino acid/polyamine antiporter
MTSTTTRPSVLPKGHLLRILGVGFGIAVIVGGAIGSGILRTPGLVAGQLGSPRLIIAIWSVGGIYAFCCTLSVIELGTMLPRAGGWYVYSRRAFGEYAGFLVGCIDWIGQAVAVAYLAVAFADFAAELQPSFHGYVKLVSVASVVVLTLLNWLGLRAGSRIQELTSLIKALALIAFVVACFVISPLGAGNGSTVSASLAAPGWGPLLGVLLALQAVIIAYDGWYFAILFRRRRQ